MVQLTITFYLLGYALSQLISGAIADTYGTRKSSIISLLIFMLLGMGIVGSPNIYIIDVLRLLQGVSVGFFAVAQRSIIPNLFRDNPKQMHSLINYSLIAWSMGPIIAPAIGGHLQHSMGWKSNFIFLVSYTLVMLILVIFCSIEAVDSAKEAKLSSIKKSYSTILSDRYFTLSIICLSTIYTIAVAFNTIGAFIIESTMGYSAVFFGYCSLSLGIAWLIGSIGNRFIQQYSLTTKILFCCKMMQGIAIVTFICLLFKENVLFFVIPLTVMNLFGGMIFSSYYAVNLARFPKFSGNAAGLMSSGLIF